MLVKFPTEWLQVFAHQVDQPDGLCSVRIRKETSRIRMPASEAAFLTALWTWESCAITSDRL
jgi:hypothetical protein